MGEAERASKSPPRIEIDAGRVRALAEALTAATRLPVPATPFERFQPQATEVERRSRLSRGVYLFHAGESEADAESARHAVHQVLECFRRHSPSESGLWDSVDRALGAGRAEPALFLARVLRNDGRFVVDRAREWGVAADALAVLGLYAARPFRRAAAAILLAGVKTDDWPLGLCPVCGHWPAFAYLTADEGQRALWCGACETTWRFPRLRCPFCLTSDAGKLPYLTIDGQESLPVYVCNECRRYLKHRREEKGGVRDADLDNLLTAPWDYVAMSEGYIQEPLTGVRFEDPEGEEGRMHRAIALRGAGRLSDDATGGGGR